MPGYRTHLSFAAGSGGTLIALLYLNAPDIHAPIMLPAYFFSCLFGSLFPDVDISSRGQQYYYLLLIPLFYFSIKKSFWPGVQLGATLALIPPFLSHRGITHRISFLIALSGLMGLVGITAFPEHSHAVLTLSGCFLFGGCTHILLDYQGALLTRSRFRKRIKHRK